MMRSFFVLVILTLSTCKLSAQYCYLHYYPKDTSEVSLEITKILEDKQIIKCEDLLLDSIWILWDYTDTEGLDSNVVNNHFFGKKVYDIIIYPPQEEIKKHRTEHKRVYHFLIQDGSQIHDYHVYFKTSELSGHLSTIDFLRKAKLIKMKYMGSHL